MDFYLFLILLIMPLFFMLYTFRQYHDDHRAYKLFQMIFCVTLFFMSGFLFISDHEVSISYVEEKQPFTHEELHHIMVNTPLHSETINVTNATEIRVFPYWYHTASYRSNWTGGDIGNCQSDRFYWWECENYRHTYHWSWDYVLSNEVKHTTTVIAEPEIMYMFGTMYTGLGVLMVALSIGETFSFSYWALNRRGY